ncbi:pilin [Micromonospora globbae]|uniref:Pilin n=1 Tax=Micromonospora globbae TaxID=1894969 RepID=A0ABZ1S3Q2_9ACTN|nr:pilin [Micromonospora globbae]
MFRISARRRALIHSRAARRAARVVAVAGGLLLFLSVPAAAYADSGAPLLLAVNSLPVVIWNLQAWLMGILAALATLFLVLAGVYWATAGGDPSQVERAKGALRNALVGYGVAVLAPVLLQVVRGIVGG